MGSNKTKRNPPNGFNDAQIPEQIAEEAAARAEQERKSRAAKQFMKRQQAERAAAAAKAQRNAEEAERKRVEELKRLEAYRRSQVSGACCCSFFFLSVDGIQKIARFPLPPLPCPPTHTHLLFSIV